jgi:ubiquinone/menaquinone biosynthesis C-methylase UbiE
MPQQSISFDRAASYYDQTRGFPPGEDSAAAAVIAAAGGLTADSRVLEIGVGTGRVALPLSRHVKLYVGVDISPAMMARLRAKQDGEPVALVQASAVHLPFAPATFDAVVAVHVFHLIPDWPDALAECARVLKPGGLLLHCWNDRSYSAMTVLRDAWRQVVPEESEQRPGVSFDYNNTFALDHGWRTAGAPHVHAYIQQRSPAEFLASQRQRVFSGSWHLDEELVARGVAAVEAAIAAHFDDPQTPIPDQMTFTVQPFAPPAPTDR